jgi:hypothetical protein
MMIEDEPEEGKEPMYASTCANDRVNDRTAVEAIASILRHLVTEGLIQPEAATRTMTGSSASLSNPREIDLWEKAAGRFAGAVVKH